MWPSWPSLWLLLQIRPEGATGTIGDREEASSIERAVRSFERLWELVVVGRESRGGHRLPGDEDDVQDQVRRVCQFGVDGSTAEIAHFLLGAARPAVDFLEVHDAFSAEALDGFAKLRAEFGAERVQLQQESDGDPPHCDFLLFSEAAPRFSIDRLRRERRLPAGAAGVVVAWVPGVCDADGEEGETSACTHLAMQWERTLLMRRGYCLPQACMSRVPADELRDPNVLPLDCERFLREDGSSASVSEFGQDWFAFWNFIRHRGEGVDGVYVDVGAALPFEYSNTVILDRCLGWRGVCVEPNPHLAAFLRAYRSCEMVQHCVHSEIMEDKIFCDRGGEEVFRADCLPLGEILSRAHLPAGRIDVLSIDVEHGELRALEGLPLDEFDIRVIVVEVSRGVRELEIDTALLPHGYAKVAILGRDAVYAKLEELQRFAQWPILRASASRVVLPEGWAEFHARVLDEERKEEAAQERAAFERGLRRFPRD